MLSEFVDIDDFGKNEIHKYKNPPHSDSFFFFADNGKKITFK